MINASVPKILIIEDEPSIAENISYALGTDGFCTEVCGTAENALQKLQTETFALIVLDVGLPDMSGFELAKEIRKGSLIPIVFLTARSSEIDRIVGFELGADDYVVKPFSPRELSARIKAILRRTQMKNSTQSCSAKSFTIDTAQCKISYCGVHLDLSRYEFRILSLFVENPNRVFSRERLMQLVWESPEMSLERTVDTHIKTLRKKLSSIRPETKVIRTHRGFGYSLSEDE